MAEEEREDTLREMWVEDKWHQRDNNRGLAEAMMMAAAGECYFARAADHECEGEIRVIRSKSEEHGCDSWKACCAEAVRTIRNLARNVATIEFWDGGNAEEEGGAQ